jgi:hypothetical protein
MFCAGAGVIAVQASPTCQRFVKTYVTVPVRNKVSKATALAWAKWRVGHPNWKQKPGVTRPKYRMTRKEAMDKVAFACEVPTTPATADMFFTPADFNAPPAADLPPVETAQVDFPDLIPPVTTDTPPFAGIPDIPNVPGIFIPPYVPAPVFGGGPGPKTPLAPVTPPIGPVPEPASFLLVILGVGSGGLFYGRRATARAA